MACDVRFIQNFGSLSQFVVSILRLSGGEKQNKKSPAGNIPARLGSHKKFRILSFGRDYVKFRQKKPLGNVLPHRLRLLLDSLRGRHRN
ncbi:hypothetical protein, partial [Paenibacillus sp. 32O-W]|uniref:hypothetical protein n=1 Tax=Paenibacillus sp. 32O-W TaxID=1695218 RepID=UPI001C92C3F3